jgi:hypothetical protein
MKERRDFIRSIGFAMTTLVLTRSLSASAAIERSLDAASREFALSFSELVRLKGARFKVSGGASAGQYLELDEVVNASRDPRLETVSLRFKGAVESRLAERMYRISRPGWGAFDLFIQPGTVTGGHCSYRVIVCRFA